jgi:hypothetical protein
VIAGLIAGVTQVIMSFVTQFLAGILGVTFGGNDVGTAALVGVVGAGFTGVVGLLCVIPVAAIGGAILAVIGYFIAQEMK